MDDSMGDNMTNNRSILSNFLWRFFERWGAQGVTLIVSVILARILGPEVYGDLALIMVFITILQVFVDSGLGIALIQKKEADDLDFSSVFWFNLVACLCLYALVFFLAPTISSFYNRQDLTSVIRVTGIIIIISGLKNIQQSYVSKNMMFKKFFFSTLGGTIGAAIIGIGMAFLGFGIWALVVQHIFNMLVDTIILWFTVKWRPKFIFSFDRFKRLFSFGWKMLVSTLIDTFYNQIRSLIIGKYYSSEDLAYYSKGEQFPNYAVQNINSSMNSVLLPVLAERQDDIISVKSATRKVIRISSFIIWPMMIGLCVAASNFILLLLGEKWMEATAFLRILCFAKALQPLQTTNLSVIKALGRSDMHLIMEITKKAIAIIIVVISAFFGVKAIAIGSVLYAVIATMINSFPNRKLIHYSYGEQIKDILPFVMISIVMGIFVFLVGLIPLPIWSVFALQIITGVVSYYLISKLFKIEAMTFCLDFIRGTKRKEAKI